MAAFPLRLDAVADIVQVLFLEACADNETIHKALESARCLRVRGPVVAAWARHLASAWGSELGIQLDAAALAQYESFDGVPTGLLDNMFVPRTEEEATVLRSQWAFDREGMSPGVPSFYSDAAAPEQLSAAATVAAAAHDALCEQRQAPAPSATAAAHEVAAGALGP
ncbi:hypothetical protein GPECTOR_229g515 [Gonium pectorale]|uniref:Uncharacterized protein n=1 Tax=Gonium pectorale TaxID=33097 RepID=A0A150FWL5_GONPE|nr:hypothetical protein GPECTOR_229g515 [Gonium pectorale]|eukprot:KXZ41989.1 hypothetical protein GPECTOR_229g515 [Gonium pectorale]